MPSSYFYRRDDAGFLLIDHITILECNPAITNAATCTKGWTILCPCKHVTPYYAFSVQVPFYNLLWIVFRGLRMDTLLGFRQTKMWINQASCHLPFAGIRINILAQAAITSENNEYPRNLKRPRATFKFTRTWLNGKYAAQTAERHGNQWSPTWGRTHSRYRSCNQRRKMFAWILTYLILHYSSICSRKRWICRWILHKEPTCMKYWSF